MSDFREEEKLGKLYDSALTRRLMKYLRPYRWHVVAAVSITLGVTAMEIVCPICSMSRWINTSSLDLIPSITR